MDFIEKLFLVAFGLLTSAIGGTLWNISGKVEALTSKQNADLAGIVEKLNSSTIKINETITLIEVEQAGFKARIEDKLDAIAAQKQHR